MRGLTRCLSGVAGAIALTIADRPAALSAQDASRVAALARADSIRASLRRPPPRPAFDGLDAAQLPLTLIGLPLDLLFRGIGAATGLVEIRGPTPFYVEGLGHLHDAGIRPGIRASIGPRSGLAGTVRIETFAPFFLETGISLRGSQRHRAGLALTGDRVSLKLEYGFHRDAEAHFWGLGSRSPRSSRSDFLRDRQDAEARVDLRLADVVELTGALGYENDRIDRGFDGSRPDLQDAFAGVLPFGAAERLRYLRYEIGSTLDLTHRAGFQTRGARFRAAATLFRGTGGTRSDFHRLEAEASLYLPLNPRQLLALRALAQTNDPDGGAGVPFYHLAALGGSRTLRAYDTERFRDRNLALLQTEWRYEVWRDLHERSRLEFYLFLEEGAVSRRFSDLPTADFRHAAGIGTRLVSRRSVALVTWLGFGGEGSRAGVRTTWPF